MRLIDADALISMLRESKYMIYHANATLPIIQNNEIERCISFVETAPTIKTFTLADIEENYRKGLEKGLEERPHGEWILDAVAPCTISWFRCSYCGYKYDAYKQSNFCPWCGADMREGELE